MQQAIIVEPSNYSKTSELNTLLNDGYTVVSVTANYIAVHNDGNYNGFKEGGWLVILTKGASEDC